MMSGMSETLQGFAQFVDLLDLLRGAVLGIVALVVLVARQPLHLQPLEGLDDGGGAHGEAGSASSVMDILWPGAISLLKNMSSRLS